MKPLLLDTFCKAGGCTKGYQRAGFRVVGCDIEPQPRYVGDDFILMDALELLRRLLAGERVQAVSGQWYCLADFAAIHASPPCQGYANVTRWTGNQDNHPRLIAPVRELLKATDLPYVIENVRTKELNPDLMLCGTMFGLRVIRHRYFEAPWMTPVLLPACNHSDFLPFEHKAERDYADAMGCEWMDKVAARQAIPPAFTQFVGGHLIAIAEAA